LLPLTLSLSLTPPLSLFLPVSLSFAAGCCACP